jgi:hypothetical protein
MKHLFADPAPASGAAATGTWKLPPGRAVTLSPREPGLLEVVYGEVWATFDGPHEGPLNDLGDHVVRAGDRLWIPAGQHLVVESWRSDAPAFLRLDPVPANGAPRPAVAAPAACCAAS